MSAETVIDDSFAAERMYEYKTSYIDTVGEIHCNSNVELAEPQNIGKTLGV